MNEPGGPFTLTHQDLARIVGVSVTTIKSYRRKFPEFFFPPSQTKPLRFRPETEKICLKIAALFTQGWSIKRARQELSRVFPVTMPTDSLPIAATGSVPAPAPVPSQPGPATDQLERVLLLLGQMNKGLGAMATAQARFALDSQKERSRLDTLMEQQAALASRLDILSRNLGQALERLLPASPKPGETPPPPIDNLSSAITPGSHANLESAPNLELGPIARNGSGSSNPLSPDETPGQTSAHEPGLPEAPFRNAPGNFPFQPEADQASSQNGEPLPGPAPHPPTRRVIHVQGRSGTQAYEFAGAQPNTLAMGGTPESSYGDSLDAPAHVEATIPGNATTVEPPSQTQHIESKPDFLHLPVVLLSSRGEYLGLTGTSGHPFTLAELEIYLSQRPDLRPLHESWKGSGLTWTLNLGTPDSSTGWHAFHITRTQTPKGNQVALLTQLDLDGKPVTEGFLQAFFRQIRDALTN